MAFRFFTLLLVSVSFFSCGSDDFVTRDNNPFLGESSPNFELDLTLVSNGDLNFNGGERFIGPNEAIGSIQGVYIRRFTDSLYAAFELAEPNNPINNCSVPTSTKGVNLEYICGSQISRYDFVNGLKENGNENDFPLRRYNVRIFANGNKLQITR